MGKIQHFVWHQDDQYIITCSNSGIICIWSVYTGQRLYEYIEKQVQFKQIFSYSTEAKCYIFALDRSNTLRVLYGKCIKGLLIESDSTISSNSTNNNNNVNSIEDLYLEKIIDLKSFSLTCFSSFKNNVFFSDDKGHIFYLNYSFDEKEKVSDIKILLSNLSISLFNDKSSAAICQLDVASNCLSQVSNSTKNYLLIALENGLLILCNMNNNNNTNNTINRAIITSDKNHFLLLMSSPEEVNTNTNANANSQEQVEIASCTKFQQVHSTNNDILIAKSDIKKLISNDLNLKQNLVELEDEQNYQIKLKDMIHKEQTKTINYEAKLNLTCLRGVYKELKQTSEDKLRRNYHKFENEIVKFKKDLELIKKNAENELNEKFLYFSQLYQEYLKLEEINRNLVENINRVEIGDSSKEVLVNIDYEKIEITELEQEIKLKLKNLANLTKLLEEENSKIELEGDRKIQNLIEFHRQTIHRIRCANEATKLEICLVRRKLFNLREKFSNLKHKQKNHDTNCLTESKKLNIKLEQVQCVKKLMRIRDDEFNLKQKEVSNLIRKLEHLRKINSIYKFEFDQISSSCIQLKAQNEKFKKLIHLNEEKLTSIVFKKINFLKLKEQYMTNKI